MTSRDWDFAIGSLGDPLADIKHWMIPPFPQRRRVAIEDEYDRGFADGRRDLAKEIELMRTNDLTPEETLEEINTFILEVIHG